MSKMHKYYKEKKREMSETGETSEGQIDPEFKEVCINYHSLEYISNFEQILFELIYRILRHNNSKTL